MTPLIRIRDLRFQYPDGTIALQGVDFDLHAGETVALLGANGSGKTTFILHLNGLLHGEGEIEICAMKPEKANLAKIRRRVGVVFQDSDEQLFMPTVLEDVAFGPANLGVSAPEALDRARQALARVGMAELAGKAPYHLSAGEKRRVALAGVLVMEPEILVLDEPTTFLDPPGQRGLLELLKGLPQSKVVVTHDISFARDLATRAVFFEKGTVAADGPFDDVIQRFAWY